MLCYYALAKERRLKAAKKAAAAGGAALEELVTHMVFIADPEAKPHLGELRGIIAEIDWDHLVDRLAPDRTLPLVHLKLDGAGKTIRYWRQRRRLSQEELGERCGLAGSYVAAVENGAVRLRPDKIDEMALALGVTVDLFAKTLLKYYYPEYYSAIFGQIRKVG